MRMNTSNERIIEIARPRCEWSMKRWRFIKYGGPIIKHVVKVKKRKMSKPVPSHRLVPIDRSRYEGERLRVIRNTSHNWKGELRR